ncbi:hypothetical protein [Enterovibrio calviensis]|uniref:hypothetical protein n=1 Tax=Enterovibrio calviensis TaxID=91359 RepID=UPI00048A0DE7|nr:hypothetical protein [Enterovibrio calviensis]
MNKSFLTNAIAAGVFAAGYFLDQPIALYGGLFALSGSLTNLLAVHMLFEKVPGIYGSGVIQMRFEAFKLGIRSLMMDQFFTKENIDRFLNKEMSGGANLNLDPVIEKIDFNPTFDGLVDVINNSQFGGMLMMLGGAEALDPLREPFVAKMRESVIDITQQDDFRTALKSQIEQPEMLGDITANIETVIEQRLDELTPNMVKDIVQKMIREHLGWLVVWGGVFGGVIGVVSALIAG